MQKKELDNFLIKGNLNLLPATFLDEKDSQVLTRTSSLMRAWPDKELYPSLLHALLRFPRQFKKVRSSSHLGRVITAGFFYKKKVIKAVDHLPQKRHLYLKLLKTQLHFPFGTKGVMGMVVTFNLMNLREAFEEQHILEAVRRVVPGVSVVKGSLIDEQDKHEMVHSVYFEIEREERPEFSIEEMKKLQTELPDELKGCIEQLVPMTFMRRNEEEVYRNVLALRDQLKTVRDLPQATISFEEQTQFDLYFTVVLLRLVKEDDLAVEELWRTSPSELTFIPDRIDNVGSLRRIYQKEATIFRVQVPKSAFFRKDRSVNLYKARRQVVAMLTKAVGPIRDYNGGLILKQNERLEDFIALMPPSYDEFALENFFYSINPIALQSILPAAIVKRWFEACHEALDGEEEVLCIQEEGVSIVIVRTQDPTLKEPLSNALKQLNIPSLELGIAELNRDDLYCFGFLYRPSLIDKGLDLSSAIRTVLEKSQTQTYERQQIRIAIRSTEPSLDPRITKHDQSYIIIKMLFEGLTRLGPDGKPQLAIAKAYDVSTDFKTYMFHLRESKWSNGAPITAYDFEYSWKNALISQDDAVSVDALYLIKNARAARERVLSLDEVGIHAVDRYTLVVELEYPVPYFLEVVSHWTYSLINSSIDRKNPGWAYQADENYVSNGPFKLTEWRHNRAIIVEKNPHYWDADAVVTKRISIEMLERSGADLTMLEQGRVDILGRPLTAYPSGEGKGEFFDVNALFSVCFNTKAFPFNHKKIRHAFALSIDRSQHKLREFSGASYTLLPEALSLHNEPLFPECDLARARALFREGLGEIGIVKSDFPQLALSFYNGSQRRELFEELAEQWEAAFEIPIHLKPYDWKAYYRRLQEGDYQIGGSLFEARWNDPLHILEWFEERGNPLNFSAWESEVYKKLMRQARQAPTLEARNQYLKEAEALLAEEMPAFPLYKLQGCTFKSPELRDVFISNCHSIDFKWAHKSA